MGGLYDVFTPRLPPSLQNKCAGDKRGLVAIRELLRALGGCLIAIGAAVVVLATTLTPHQSSKSLALILLLVLPSEGMNAFGMRRVGSPYLIPLFFILLTAVGVLLAVFGG